jgi:hypothetical protein
VLGKVPTISIDKTDGCQMYLSPESLDVEIISSKSSEMNVLVPKGNGDYVSTNLKLDAFVEIKVGRVDCVEICTSSVYPLLNLRLQLRTPAPLVRTVECIINILTHYNI